MVKITNADGVVMVSFTENDFEFLKELVSSGLDVNAAQLHTHNKLVVIRAEVGAKFLESVQDVGETR